jgi:serine/threonine-protein kinase
LDKVHRKSIIHRDIKPANILLSNDGDVKIADFGIAKKPNENTIVASRIKGTLSFMAPEHIRDGTINERTDIYSLGLTLYTVATGKSASDVDPIFLNEKKEPIVPISCFRPDISPELEKIFMKCVEKNPSERFQTVEELSEQLHMFIKSSGDVKKSRFKDFIQPFLR